MNKVFIVDWDIPTNNRRMFYYHLKKLREKYDLTESSMSVMAISRKDAAEEVYALASKYGRSSLYHAEILNSNNP